MRITISLLNAFVAVQVLFFIPSSPAKAAEKLDCPADLVSQQDINFCSDQNFQEADKALNAIYQKARAVIRSWDDETGEALKSFVNGQKGWIAYRNGYCTAYAYQAHGGSLEPMLVTDCMTALTKSRTEELISMIAGQDN